VLGGFIAQHVGNTSVFVFSTGLALAWLMLAIGMTPPPAVRTRMFHVGEIDAAMAQRLTEALSALRGVSEAVVIAGEGVAYLKVSMGEWDEAGARQLIEGGI